jgi:hypothetical protein
MTGIISSGMYAGIGICQMDVNNIPLDSSTAWCILLFY